MIVPINHQKHKTMSIVPIATTVTMTAPPDGDHWDKVLCTQTELFGVTIGDQPYDLVLESKMPGGLVQRIFKKREITKGAPLT